MIEKAKERKVYDELVCAELTGWLEQNNIRFSAICAADVLTYSGDLAPMFNAVYKRLEKGGLFVFIVEGFETRALENEHSGQNYVLRRYGRYTHSRSYIDKLAGQTGFKILATRDDVLRYEVGTPSVAVVYALNKSESGQVDK